MRFPYCLCLVAFLSVYASPGVSVTSQCDVENFNNIYFLIGLDSIAEVSDYFGQIPEKFPLNIDDSIAVKYGERKRLVSYFDDRNLNILKNHRELFIDVIVDIPTYRGDREKVYFKNNNDGSASVDIFEVRQYKRKNSALDKHELFGRIKRNLRPILIDKIKSIPDLSVSNIKTKMLVEHNEALYIYSHFGNALGAISLDRLHISNYGVPNTFSLLKFELDTDRQLKYEEINKIKMLFCSTSEDLKKRYPKIKVFDRFGYTELYNLALRSLPTRKIFQDYPVLYKLGQIIVLLLLGYIFLYLFVSRYTGNSSHRITTVRNRKKNHE